MIMCLGDSLTRGTVGYSYIKFFKKGKYKNCGVNGDTTYGALKRLHKYADKKWYADVDTCVVAIGTNDLLQPFLCEYSLFWKVFLKRRVSWKKWAMEPENFEELYREIIELLLNSGKKVVLVGLSMIQLRRYPLDKLHERNEIVRRLAEHYGLGFVDILSIQETERPGSHRDYDWGQTGIVRGLDILLMLIFPFTKDWFSKLRGLELTVDGVHYNSFTANLLATETARALRHTRKK